MPRTPSVIGLNCTSFLSYCKSVQLYESQAMEAWADRVEACLLQGESLLNVRIFRSPLAVPALVAVTIEWPTGSGCPQDARDKLCAGFVRINPI